MLMYALGSTQQSTVTLMDRVTWVPLLLNAQLDIPEQQLETTSTQTPERLEESLPRQTLDPTIRT